MHYKVDEKTGCWIWQLSTDKNGYGITELNSKKEAAHRVYYKKYKGLVPDKLLVLHKCDNPPCVNPEHLFLGTQKQNIQDAINKGRFYGGTETHCVRNHEYTEGNTGYNSKSNLRFCKNCKKQSDERRKESYRARHNEIVRAYKLRKKNKENALAID